MLRYALHTLVQNRLRFLLSIGGVALALALVLIFDAIFTGVEGRLSAYIDHSGADVWVAQQGVENLHMVSSQLPATVVTQVQQVPGVAAVTPMLYVTDTLTVNRSENRYVVYVIGLPPGARMGGPWDIAQGATLPNDGQTIIDQTVARQEHLGIGDTVTMLGQPFTIAGLANGTGNIINSVTFITLKDFARIDGNRTAVSFVLVKVAPGASPGTVAAQIERDVRGVTALPRQAFAAQERKLVADMASSIITIMNVIGFAVGLAVLALTVYTATFARRKEYGLLKALGARNSYLYGVVVTQALTSALLGFIVALTLTLLLAVVVPALGYPLTLQVSETTLLTVGGVSFLITALAAVLPIRQIAGLDPALVFKGA